MQNTEHAAGLKPAALAGLGLALLPACPLAGTFLSLAVPPGTASLAFASLASAVMAAALAAWLGRRAGCRMSAPATATGLLSGVACTVAAYPAAMLVAESMARALPGSTAAAVPTHSLPAWLAWALLALAPAVSEEMLFRGLVYGSARRHGAAFAVLASAACFASVHGSFQQAAYTFLMGAIWALLRECTGSVWPSMVGHLAFNTAGLVTAYGPAQQVSHLGPPPSLWPLACLALAGLGACAAVLKAAHGRHGDYLDAGQAPLQARQAAACAAILAAGAAVNIAVNVALSGI